MTSKGAVFSLRCDLAADLGLELACCQYLSFKRTSLNQEQPFGALNFQKEGKVKSVKLGRHGADLILRLCPAELHLSPTEPEF